MSKASPETALKLLQNNKASGRMKIDNPKELMDALTKRYGENAPDLVVRAIKEPTKLMKDIGQDGTTSAKTLEYLVSDKISEAEIQKLGGTVEQASTGFKLEPLTQAEEKQLSGIMQTNSSPIKPQEEITQIQQPDLSQLGNVDVYGNKLQNQSQDTNPSDNNNADNYQDDRRNNQQFSDPWSELLSNLLSGDMEKMIGAALALQIANQASLAFNAHYTPFPYHCHPYRDRIDYFNGCVDNRSKTEKTLDKIADVAHGVAGVTHGVAHIVGAIKGKDRGMG